MAVVCAHPATVCVNVLFHVQVATVDVRQLNVGEFTQADKTVERSFRASNFEIFHSTAPFAGVSPDLHSRLGKALSITPQSLLLPDAPLRLQLSPRFAGLSFWTRNRPDLFLPRARFADIPSLRAMLRDDLTVGLMSLVFQSHERVRCLVSPRGDLGCLPCCSFLGLAPCP